MKRRNKIVIAMVAVVGISAASISYVSAGGRWGDCGNGPTGMHGYENTERGHHGSFRGRKGDHSERMTQRLDMVKYQLRITEAQEPAWQAFEQALKSKLEARKARFSQRDSDQPKTIAERVSQMRQGSADMAELATQMETLYAELTPKQQKVADAMRPMGMGRMH